MKTSEIRQAFLDFFQGKGHEVVDSSSLVPANDPTLLFTNAGMVQFKDVFLGQEQRAYQRATSSQKCVRAGGKHNDLENVGYTARHHTFFEMLGNFSFGDYFKREAIGFAWEFVTEVLKLPKEKLWITVFEEDDEAAKIWLDEIGVSPKQFSRCGEKDNFWSMGDTGPCGPCSEIFYDHGPDIAGGPPGSPEEDGDRYIEIWNLVFMQYDRDMQGKLTPLPKPSVDTGMGLERVAAIMQGKHNNYEIDLFKNLIDFIVRRFEIADPSSASLKVIADHVRSCAFLVADGVYPSNDGRGYVLRRIMRRAMRHGHKLGILQPFFHQLVAPLVQEMGHAFPELKDKQAIIEQTFLREAEQFDRTLAQGLKTFEQYASALKEGEALSGEIVFLLYDTYGFPVDLTADIARERGMELDMHGFEQAMLAQRERARKASQFKLEVADINVEGETHFEGYEHDTPEKLQAYENLCEVKSLFVNNQAVEMIEAGQQATVVLDKTPFYAESGGQVGDAGELVNEHASFLVEDTQKQAKTFLHIGTLKSGTLSLGERLIPKVNVRRRADIMLNHSATHLMHAALKQILGPHVEQKGSVVDAARLRFDFSHPEAMSTEEIAAVEACVNEEIMRNTMVKKEVMSKEDAMAKGACALFGEKYEAQVRVLTMGDGFSVELCGGTHVERTGDIGFFKIIQETGVASGVRRIEAITGRKALEWAQAQSHLTQRLANQLKTKPDELEEKVHQTLVRIKKLEKELQKAQLALASGKTGDVLEQAKEIQGIHVLAATLPGGDAKALRDAVDRCKNKLQSAAIVLALADDDKVQLVAGVTKDCMDKIPAGELVNFVALQVGGKGGGRPDMAQAGGKDVAALEKALASVYDWVQARL